MLKLEAGTPWYTKTDSGEFKEPKLSSFIPTEKLLNLCAELGYRTRSVKDNPEHHVELRNLNDKLLPFQTTPYSMQVEQLMYEYCAYLNQQKITIDSEDLGRIHLIGKYKDWDGSGRLIHGGRTHNLSCLSQNQREEELSSMAKPLLRWTTLQAKLTFSTTTSLVNFYPQTIHIK